jgi:hypothetical protein
MNGERRAREDTWGRLCNPARLAQPQRPTLRTSHFPDPPPTTLRQRNQPLDKHRGTEEHRPIRLSPRLPRVRRHATQQQATQTAWLANSRRSARPATLGPRQTARCCVDRLNPPCHEMPVSGHPIARPERNRSDTMGCAVEASPERFRHHLRRPDADEERLIMKPPLTPLIGQTPSAGIEQVGMSR